MGINVPRVLAMVAHPDDESFGLGAVIAWLCGQSYPVSAVVFTQGEASTLGAGDDSSDLGALRSGELGRASRILGLSSYKLHSYPDGRLNEVSVEERVLRGEEAGPGEVVLAFYDTGVTGHPDHIAATEAAEALAIQHGAAFYLWTLPEDVAAQLSERFNIEFKGRPNDEITTVLDVSKQRDIQWKAIHCHESQLGGIDVVRARLELLGDREYLIERSPGTLNLSPFDDGADS
jgi:LmbE family N-acetylglucosaminyl deacetylase